MKIEARLDDINSQLQTQFSKVFEMMEFDKDFIKLIIESLEEQRESLLRLGIENQSMLPDKPLRFLNDLFVRGPTRRKYQPIYSQSLVLMVSYFGSAVSSIFHESLTSYLNNVDDLPKRIAQEEVKFSLRELNDLDYDLSTEIGRVISRKSDISFQDMKSIHRVFERYFDLKLNKDRDVDNIIAAQSLRHAIVHNSEKIDEKCFRQLQVAKVRTLKRSVAIGEKIAIEREDLETVRDSMCGYVEEMVGAIKNRLMP